MIKSIPINRLYRNHNKRWVFNIKFISLCIIAGFASATITAVAMVIRIVDASGHFALPLIFASLIGSYIASLFGDSIYHQQVLIYIDKDKYHATR